MKNKKVATGGMDLPRHKKVRCGGFPNPKKDAIRRTLADLAFSLLEANSPTLPYTVTCPGMRTNEHEVVSYKNREDLVILAEHSPDICALNPKAIPGDIVDVLMATGPASYPQIAVLDMDIFRGSIKPEYAGKIMDALKSDRMRHKFCVRAVCPYGRGVGPTPAKELDVRLRKAFRIMSYSEMPYKGGANGHGACMKIFQWVCEK